ncbi:hypothetical protein PAHAL_4G304600 [Panicum hallii]|jgi:Leucine-rich repeat (LRR) protein|uniref:Leucine-rich repeat-containing N-terminal plant-type domain-containing protein n=1 Tax=Panicum hallii TaxID=206008 RepID=A0A2T8JEH5_9POAL|nr:hypothetical protein PAHAL_4G304600 [Panicum hallii]
MGPLLEQVLTALALWSLVISTREAAACIPGERDALVAFNASINDPHGRLSSWQGENCCDWSGIICRKETGHVVQLDLGGYALQGEISPSLAGLTNLVYLNLSQSDFGGASIPEFIGSFKLLRYLDLSSAHFGGPVPPRLGNLTRLQYLNLSDSLMITVNNFHWVSKLTSLRYLDLSWLYLATASDWLQALNMLPLLQELHLNDASLPATNLNCLPQVNFTTIKILDLKSNSNMNSSLPSWIWNLSSLSELDLSSCGLSGRIPDELGKLTSLRFLSLADNKLKGGIPGSASSFCNLVHIDLSGNLLSGNITEIVKGLLPCMNRLQILKLANNKLKGYLSGWLEQMASLRILDLSKNSLSGDVPASMGKLSNLTHLDISFNSFGGKLSEVHFVNLSRLDTLILSSNSFKIAMKEGWVPPFQLRELGMHACLVGPQFPTWLQSQSRIEMIDLGCAGISDVLPGWIWNFSSSVTSLNISTNNITGMLPASLEQLKMLTSLNLRYNRLEGSIPDLPTSVQLLDLSYNHLSGSLPHSFGGNELYYLLLSNNSLIGAIPEDLCNMVLMEVIDLSRNHLSGEVPNCWNKNSNLYIIDFSSNNFWGEIPSAIGSLDSLITLHLGKNNFSGTLPTSLQSSNRLVLLDLGENNLSGNIPKWIGDSLQALQFLNLRSNQFSGEIPTQLSQLNVLQCLDLSNNKLSGPVPHFLGNFTAMHHNPEWSITTPFIAFMVYGVGGAYFSVYTDTLQMTYKGYTFTFTRPEYLKGIDLSANQLTGEIPSELGFLTGLASLNLSRNCIGGSIPDELRRMTCLHSLDLSWNGLSGPIPQSLTSLEGLSHLNLSYNYLSGNIPLESQFATFVKDSYLGNANLCGPPVSRICLPNSSKHRHHKLPHHFDTMTYLYMLLGFASGFSIVLVILISSAAARKAYFEFTDDLLRSTSCKLQQR